MPHWKLTLAYDGSAFHGWQVQPGLRTIQGTLASALHRLTGENVLPQGSGRTDSGVHALAQVASFTLEAPIPPANLQLALNRSLPPSIRILSAEEVPADFHARHSARQKTYEYRLFPRKTLATTPGAPYLATALSSSDVGSSATNHPSQAERICPPTLAPYVWDCPRPLDLDLMHQAAQQVLGEHDFTSFAAHDPDRATRDNDPGATPPTNIRTIRHSHWREEDGLYLYRVTGSGFLHHMVRNLVGTFADAGSNRIHPADIPAILAAKDRQRAGPTAPASGLFLLRVDY